jgi:peptide/nickel transport system substrate-binding protein
VQVSRNLGLVAVFVVLLVGCGPSSPTAPNAPTAEAPRSAVPKRILVGILGEPYTLSRSINAAGIGSVRGVSEIEQLIHLGLTGLDARGSLTPRIAEAVPSIENRLWKVFPDGRMETTWKIRPNATWHDSTAVTAADLVFTLQVGQDKDLALTSYPGYSSIESIQSADDRTATVTWKRPFIEADRLFSNLFALPMPRHLLESTYTTDKADFLDQPYWTSDFVGTGPFRVREFVRGSHMALQAYDQFVQGRPKVDDVLVKFIQDPNTLIANLLAGEVQVTVGRGLNLEQGLQVAGQWTEGRLESKPANWIAHYPQLLTPSPAVIGDVRFRRALLHAMDRQNMSDSLQAGQAPVAHTWYEIGAPDFKEVEPSIVKYEYAPRRAVQIVEELGYAKGADGFFRDGSGQPLVIQSMTNAGDDLKEKMVFVGADYWKAIGIGVDTVLTPRQRASDREYRATFPGFDLVRQPFELERITSSEAALPDNKFSGKNRTRYMNADLDVLIDRYFTTIPTLERRQSLSAIVRHLSEQVVALGVFYGPEPMLINNRLVNVANAPGPEADETWNGHEWDIR